MKKRNEKTEFKKIISSSLERFPKTNYNDTHAQDILAARELINKLLIKLDKGFEENPEEKTVGNIGKLMQILIKLIEIEREIYSKTAPIPVEKEITSEDEEIIKHYAERKYRSKKSKDLKPEINSQ